MKQAYERFDIQTNHYERGTSNARTIYNYNEMKKNSIFLILILAFVFNFQGNAQIKRADKLFKFYRYSEAIPYYLKVIDSGDSSEKQEATNKLADCYRFINNVAEARFWYEKTLGFENVDTINYFYLGQALRSLGQYDLAAEAFKTFNTAYPDSLDAGNYYQYCIDIKPWLDLSDMAEIKNVENINTEYSDFGPAVFNKKIVFASDRLTDQLDNKKYGWTNSNYLNIYISQPDNFDSFWSAMSVPKSMEKHFNQSYHDGPAFFTSDNKRVYITKTVLKDGKKEGKGIRTYLLKIFYADIEEGKKFKFKPFFLNSNEYSVGHPTLSKTGDKIIFSSDMPGGFGGSDLYECRLENDKWGDPVNLGKKVNSKGNEVFPFMVNDSVLIFSSNGHLGFGGLDIFQTNLVGGEWSAPENLKKPLNSSYDDFGVLFSDDLTEGLFSSNRPDGKGADDIYAFRGLKHVVAAPAVPKLMVSGYVKELASEEPIEDATVFLFNATSDNVLILKTDETGYYQANVDYDVPFVVKAAKNEYIYDCTSFRTTNDTSVDSSEVPRDLLLAKLKVNHGFAVVNIYYDLDKWFIRDDAREPLDNLVQIMKQYPIKAELSSHTDSRASDEYNLELSQKRAEAAVRYMILEGVDPSRITARGYGKSRLLVKALKGLKLTEADHQRNRRTEFRITAIDNSLGAENSFNPDVFKVGDVISVTLFEEGFFNNCLDDKKSLQEYILESESNSK